MALLLPAHAPGAAAGETAAAGGEDFTFALFFPRGFLILGIMCSFQRYPVGYKKILAGCFHQAVQKHPDARHAKS
jgi:hypothetical protein